MTDDAALHAHGGAFTGMHSHDGGALHWHDEFGEHYSEELTEEERLIRQLDWKMHNLVLVTVGADIGSSTSHLMFSRIYMQLLGEAPKVRSVVVGREILWESPIMLTPYLENGDIDAEALRTLVQDAYAEVGAQVSDVDTGAIVLTGEALKRRNARHVGELFALETGKFVCASAGHHLEAVLAAHGSGTVKRSRRDGTTLLNIDIGGGTTKLALVDDGQIVGTAAIAVGARQIVRDDDGRLLRIDDPVRIVADHLGIQLELGAVLSAADADKIIQTWVACLADVVMRRPLNDLTERLLLTTPLVDGPTPRAVTFSGGVSEYLFWREKRDFGDLGRPLARAVRGALTNGAITIPALVDPNLGIRATAVGASLFSSQAGINALATDESILPLRNVPVLVPRAILAGDLSQADIAAGIQDALVRADLVEGDGPIALYFQMPVDQDPSPGAAGLVAKALKTALPSTIERGVPVAVLSDEGFARTVAETLRDELRVSSPLIALEQVSVAEFDFVDFAPVIHPTEAMPLTVKSLLFAGGLDKRSIRQALLDAAHAAAS
jgi:ethanolamine utilization protein EutA